MSTVEDAKRSEAIDKSLSRLIGDYIVVTRKVPEISSEAAAMLVVQAHREVITPDTTRRVLLETGR